MDPVDPIADVGSPGRFIRLPDGTILPLSGAFGQELADEAMRFGIPVQGQPAAPERGGFADPRPGKATIGERFSDWLKTYTAPMRQTFDDAMAKQRGGAGTFGISGPVDLPEIAAPVDQPQPSYPQVDLLSQEAKARRDAALIEQGIEAASAQRQAELDRQAGMTLRPAMPGTTRPLPADPDIGFLPATTRPLPADAPAQAGAFAEEPTPSAPGTAFMADEEFWKSQGTPRGGAPGGVSLADRWKAAHPNWEREPFWKLFSLAAPEEVIQERQRRASLLDKEGRFDAAAGTEEPAIRPPGNFAQGPDQGKYLTDDKAAAAAIAAGTGVDINSPEAKAAAAAGLPADLPAKKKAKGKPAAAPVLVAPVSGQAPAPTEATVKGETGGAAATSQPTDYVKVFNDLYDKIKTDNNTDLSKEERGDLIMEFGLRLMAGGQRRGASLLGALGEAGYGTLATRRRMKADKKAEARAQSALKLELTKHVTDLAEKSERLALDRQKLENEWALGMHKEDTARMQLQEQIRHNGQIEANSATANYIAALNYESLDADRKQKANGEWRLYKDMLFQNNANAQLTGQQPMSPEEIDRAAAFANPNAMGAQIWRRQERDRLWEAINGGISADPRYTDEEKKAMIAQAVKDIQEIDEVWGQPAAAAEDSDSEE